MKVDLERMSTGDIEILIADAQAVIRRREEEEREKAIEEMKRLAASVGVSFRLTSAKGKKKKPAAISSPKYRNPDKPEETWAGKGRKPPFIKEAEERGEDIEQYRIDQDQAA